MSVSTTRSLPRTLPEAEGISSAAILGFIDALEQHTHSLDAVQSFMLLRHGKAVAEGWWAPYQPDVPHMLYSLSKSFTSSAIGIAVAEGLLSVDDPVLTFFPDDVPENPNDHLKAMTVKHLLTMNTGHHEDTLSAVWGGTDENWPRAFLALPVEHEPGSWFAYNTPATYMLSAIITQLTGETLIEYLRPRLFDPLGIENPTWDADPQGRSLGGSGLHITTGEVARFGQMYLQKGEWEGQHILAEAWVEEATTAHSDNSNTESSPDWSVGYGYQFWRSRHGGYRGDGAFGQFCIVFPEQEAVLAITSGVQNMQRVLDLVWEHLLPAFGNAPLLEDASAQSKLAAKLTSLSLPVVEGVPTSDIAATVNGTTFSIESNSFGIERISLGFDGDHATITIADAVGDHGMVAGYGIWRAGIAERRVLGRDRFWSSGAAGERMAANGAWTAEDTYELRICYTEGEVCPILRFRFSDAAMSLEIDPNVSWDEPTVTTLTGRADA